jgi:ABC-type nitrate/sulfonate/bicarbonate transport system permease component
MLAELIAWSKFVRDSFDKIVLLFLTLVLIALVLHMAHDKLDEAQISWAREMTGTVLGGLLGLITGRALATSSAVTPKLEVHDVEEKKP